MATFSNILVWKIPWTVDPGRLHSTESNTTEHIHGHGGDDLSKFSIYLKASLLYKLTAILFTTLYLK